MTPEQKARTLFRTADILLYLSVPLLAVGMVGGVTSHDLAWAVFLAGALGFAGFIVLSSVAWTRYARGHVERMTQRVDDDG